MGVYVPNYQYDVFVSYSHIDDEPLPGAEDGWISTFHSHLVKILAQQLGRSDIFSIWIDHRLRGNDPVTEEIQTVLKNSATILLFLSKGYLESSWCRQELDLFVKREQPNSRRIFVIELNDLERPEVLHELPGYQFWYHDKLGRERKYATPCPDPDEHEYYAKVDDVARDLAKLLVELRNSPIQPVPQRTLPPQLGPVFLAEVPKSLKSRRDEVRRYLEQHQVGILPEKALSFSRDFQAQLENELKTTSLFIQLLNEDEGFGFPLTQYKYARDLGIKVAQWRDPSLKIGEITEEEHRELLEGPEVQATNLVEFQAYLIRQLQPPPTQNRKIDDSEMLVFVNGAPEDRDLMEMIEEIFQRHDIGFAFPLQISETTKVDEVRKDLENNLINCDAIIVLYGASPAMWVREQLNFYRKTLKKRDQDHPLRVLAVYNAPKDMPKSPLNYFLPNLKVFETPFSEFKDTLLDLLKGEG
jgi:hypothetical protein